jgi:hypothetical protein
MPFGSDPNRVLNEGLTNLDSQLRMGIHPVETENDKGKEIALGDAASHLQVSDR